MMGNAPTVAPNIDHTIEQPFCSPEARKFVLLAAILASAMGFIDGSILALALPTMRDDLGIGLGAAQWVSNGYALTLSAFLLVGGAAGDKFGTKRAFVWGVTGFVMSSLICTVAPSGDFLIVARLVQGLAAAFMVPGSLAIISPAYPASERGKAIGIWASISAMATAFGPILGGLLLSNGPDWSWRLVFAVNLPLGAAVLTMLYLRVRTDTKPQAKPIDWLGALLATMGLGLIAYGLTAPEAEIATEPNAHGFWIAGLGLLCLMAFILHQSRTKHPLMPLDLFRNRSFAAANMATFLIYFSLSAVLFYLPMTLIGGWGTEEAIVGLLFTPFALAIGLFSRLSGAWADKYGAAPLIAAGCATVSLSYILLGSLIDTGSIYGVVMSLLIVMGIGMGLLIAPLSSAVMTSAGANASGTASGINNAVSRAAGVIAVASMGRLASAFYHTTLDQEGINNGVLSYGAKYEVSAQLSQLHFAASNAAFSSVAFFCGAACAIAMVLAFFGVKPQQS